MSHASARHRHHHTGLLHRRTDPSPASGVASTRSRWRRRWAATLATVVIGASVTVMGPAGEAGAHTPSATVDCTSWSVGATDYDTTSNNTFAYSVDGGAEVTGSFGQSFSRSGTFPAGSGNHTLSGYIYQDGDAAAPFSQTFDLHTSDCPVWVPVPGAPTASAPTCTQDGVLAVAPPGDHVSVSGGRTGEGPGHYTIIYVTDTGYTFPDGSTSKTFEVTVAAQLPSESCRTPVSPVAPAVIQPSCDGTHSVPGSFVAPASTDEVRYTVSGDVVTATILEPDTHEWGALSGYRKQSDSVATYAVTYQATAPCPQAATPVEPAITQAGCTGPGTFSHAVLHIPSTTGVVYRIDGDVVTGDVPATAGTLVSVTATPAEGFLFEGDQQVTYQFTPTTPDCLVDVAAVAPTFGESACDGNHPAPSSSYTIPATAHVRYSVDGTAAAAGTYPIAIGSTLTVTAAADDGFVLRGPATFTHTFTAATCSARARVSPVLFTEDACVGEGAAGASFTVPAVPGVVYESAGAVLTAGVHEAVDGSTIVIEARAQAGYVIAGQTRFSHTFTWSPSCSGVSAGGATEAPVPAAAHTATTGAPTGKLVAGGAALLLAGVLLLLTSTARGRSWRCD